MKRRGNIIVKKIGPFLLFSLLILVIAAFSASAAGAEVVYLKNGGTGDGSSPERALGSMNDAYSALDLKKDCVIVLCGEYTQSKTFQHNSIYAGSITLTSVYDGVDYRTAAGAVYITGEFRFVSTGAFTVRDVDYHLTGKYYMVLAQFFPFVIDTGVRMESESPAFDGSSIANGFSVIAGYNNGQSVTDGGADPPSAVSKSASVTVRSGTHLVLTAFSRQIQGQRVTRTSTITVEGSAMVDRLYYAPVGATYDIEAGVVVNVGGHASVAGIFGGTSAGKLDSVTLNWMSGDIGGFSPTGGGAKTESRKGYILTYSDVSGKKENFAEITKLFKNKKRVDYDLPEYVAAVPLPTSVKTPREELTPDTGIVTSAVTGTEPAGDIPSDIVGRTAGTVAIAVAAAVAAAAVLVVIRQSKKR